MSVTIAWAILGSVSAVVLDATLVWSLVFPQRRLWPPPEGRIGVRTYAIWVLSIVPFVGGAIAGLLDMQSMGALSTGLGAVLMGLGAALVVWGIGTLSWAQALGTEWPMQSVSLQYP